MVFTSITAPTNHQGHRKQQQNLTFFLPATSLPPLRKNGSNIGEDLPDILHIYNIYNILVYSLSWRGFGLRSAHAYILVYDVTSPKVKTIDIDIHLSLKHCLFAEFYVPPIPERTNCNFKGTQWGEHISLIWHFFKNHNWRQEILHLEMCKFATKVFLIQNCV